jgi:hypothetical protein
MNYKNFLIRFNVLYLGSLCFTFLFLGAIILRGRIESGNAWVWSSHYLDSFVVASIYLILLFISVFSYLYAVWKTWQLTKSDTIINKRRLFAFGWLIGAPLFIAYTGMFWLSAMRLVTDRLFIP